MSVVKFVETCRFSSATPFRLSAIFLRNPFQIEYTE